MSNIYEIKTKVLLTIDNFDILIKPPILQYWQTETQKVVKSIDKPKTKRRELAGMKLYPKLNMYKASNVSYNINTQRAYSYDWWCFVKPIGNEIVFNTYCYSNSTRKHQKRVWALLTELGLPIMHEIDCPKGLQDLESGIYHYKDKIISLNEEINKPKSKTSKNIERREEIELCITKIKLIKRLNKKDIEVAS